jgi:hypothetical protein
MVVRLCDSSPVENSARQYLYQFTENILMKPLAYTEAVSHGTNLI